MRPATTLLQLSLLGPAVLCSPVPPVVLGDLEAVSAAAHPPAPVAASRPEHALPEVIVFKPDDGATEAPIDSRPSTPAATALPSVVLASQRPLISTYLLSIAQPRQPRRKDGRPKVVKLPADTVAAVESSSVAQTEEEKHMAAEKAEVLARIGAPCHHETLEDSHNDVLAIVLIVIFVAVVVVVEMSRSTTLLSKRGAIRLEEEPEPSAERRKPLSIQADPTDDWREKPVL